MAAGALLTAETWMKAFDTGRKGDTDAQTAYAISGAFFAVGTLFAVGSVPVSLVFYGIGFLLTCLGNYFREDDIEIFLKYCLWGEDGKKQRIGKKMKLERNISRHGGQPKTVCVCGK
jgi:hypothetical protein